MVNTATFRTPAIVFALLLGLSTAAKGQDDWPFGDCGTSDTATAIRFGAGLPRAGHPLLAEPRAAMTKVMIGAAHRFGFQQTLRNKGQLIGDFDLGHEFAIWGGCFIGRSNFGVWTPVDFHMAQSLSAETAPILNTDYRYGVVFRAAGPIADNRVWLGVKAAVGHESTHIGDEITVARIEDTSTFFRVNVSYEYWELSGSLDWRPTTSNRRTALRGGVTRTLKGRFYDADKTSTHCEPSTSCLLRATDLKTEPYVAGEVEWFKRRLSLLASVDARWKIAYTYTPDSVGGRRPSVNALLGLTPGPRDSTRRMTFFLRVYHGVNPHGQFRNDLGYWEGGVGIHFKVQ